MQKNQKRNTGTDAFLTLKKLKHFLRIFLTSKFEQHFFVLKCVLIILVLKR